MQTQAVDTQQLESQRTELEIDGLTSKAESLRQRLQDTENLTPTIQNNTLQALREKRHFNYQLSVSSYQLTVNSTSG